MTSRRKFAIALAGFAIIASLAVGAAHAATVVSFQLKNGGSVMQDAAVTLFLGYGTDSSRTDSQGQISFQLEQGRGFWIEVNGNRLNRFYQIGQVPSVIDVNQVGYMTWPGRS